MTLTYLTNPNNTQTPLDYAAPYPAVAQPVEAADTRDIDELTDTEFWEYCGRLVEEAEEADRRDFDRLTDAEFETLLGEQADRYHSRWGTSLAEDLGNG